MPKSMSAAVPVPCNSISLLRKHASFHSSDFICGCRTQWECQGRSTAQYIQAWQASDRCCGVQDYLHEQEEGLVDERQASDR